MNVAFEVLETGEVDLRILPEIDFRHLAVERGSLFAGVKF